MAKFKVGDKVKVKNLNYSGGDTKYIGRECTITRACDYGSYRGQFEDGIVYGLNENEIELLNNYNNMSLISRFKNITRTEPEKTFVKAGIMNESLELTGEGKDLFLSYLLEKNKENFKKDVVDAIVEEMDKEKE